MRLKMLRVWRWWKSHFFASLVSISPPRGVRRSNPAEHRTRSMILSESSHDHQSDILFSRTSAFLVIPPHLSHPVRLLLQAAGWLQKFATAAHRNRPGCVLRTVRSTTCPRRPGGKSPARSSARSIAAVPLRSTQREAADRPSVGAGGAPDGHSRVLSGTLDVPCAENRCVTKTQSSRRPWCSCRSLLLSLGESTPTPSAPSPHALRQA